LVSGVVAREGARRNSHDYSIHAAGLHFVWRYLRATIDTDIRRFSTRYLDVGMRIDDD
jgi:hypothetical protein